VKRAILAFALLAGSGLDAAPVERDLGLGLRYCRVHALPDDLPSVSNGAPRAWVLDVRFVRGGTGAGKALIDWLKGAAGPRTPVFLLANTQTSGEILSPLDSADSVPGLLILGPAAKDFLPDITLNIDSKTDRNAYDAFEAGARIETLLADDRAKPRNDEARLAREHLSDSALQDDDSGRPSASAKAAPLMDLVLQRAVQVHRALLALKRL
jgi:hypothetical protein